jgi:hypothetical protein
LNSAKIKVFKTHYTISRPQKKEKHSPVLKQLPQLPAELALPSAFMAKTHFKNLGFGSGWSGENTHPKKT